MTEKPKADEEIQYDDEIIQIPDEPEDNTPTKDAAKEPKKDNKLKRLWHAYLAKKKITIPLTILLLVVILLAIPFTRYGIVGLFYKKTVTVTVIDSKTSKPVSEADVSVAGKTARTDNKGVATINEVKVGNQEVQVTKKYYKDVTVITLVPIKGTHSAEIKLEATGRQVPVSVINSIDTKAVKGALVKSGESEAKTDDNGQATLVLSPESQTEKATISSEGYNQTEVNVTVTDAVVAENNFKITPSGKIYFLSKKSGKIDVVKTNLDGSDRKTVIAGTGNEDEASTTLLASRDWKYLVLQAKREDKSKIYLIETSSDAMSTIDEGNATFTVSGWSEHNFIYQVTRSTGVWEPKQLAIKSFNAGSKKLTTLDESKAEGVSDQDYAAETFGQISILDNLIVYPKNWSAGYYSYSLLSGKRMSINSIRPDGSDRKMLRDFDVSTAGGSYILSKQYKPQEVYFQVSQQAGAVTYFEYEDGDVEAANDLNLDKFNSFYPTYLISPSGNKTFWSEPRDGKNTLFLGGRNADDGKEIATLSEFTQYGWFTEDYLLVSKSGSELYIMSPKSPDKFIKVSDYHKPNYGFSGYGYGYGGL